MKKGFTLIELLIVIAVLGILAAGILATIDPFEQFKKARDTNARNSVVELYNAFVRFNANHGAWPWNYPAGVAYCSTPVAGAALSTNNDCLTALIGDGELKTGFTNALSSGVITSATLTFLTAGGTENVAVCFNPDSKTISQDQNSKYSADGTDNSAVCPDVSQACYWCAE